MEDRWAEFSMSIINKDPQELLHLSPKPRICKQMGETEMAYGLAKTGLDGMRSPG